MRKKYEPGMKFGCHTLVRRAPERSKASWIGKCDCGRELITNASAIAKDPPDCHHHERIGGMTFGLYTIADPPVVRGKNCNGNPLIEGECQCGHKKMATASMWAQPKWNRQCLRCTTKARWDMDSDTHVSLKKAITLRRITKQRIHQIIDSGVLDAERIGNHLCIIKNEKWDAWSRKKKGEVAVYPNRKMKYKIGDKIYDWEITGRSNGLWEMHCHCGKKTLSTGMGNLAKRCCHIERFFAGATFGRLTVCDPLNMKAGANRPIEVSCACGKRSMIPSSNVGNPKWRSFAKCKRCNQEYGS